MEFKIKSFIDVITNSSTEVFAIYNDKSMEKVKELFNAIFSLSNKNLTFDDIFDVEYSADDDRLVDYYDEYLTANNLAEELLQWNKLDSWGDEYDYFNNLPKETKQKVLNYVQKEHYEDDNSDMPLIDGYTIRLKENAPIGDNKSYFENIASLLSKIDNIFPHEERCC